MIKCHWYALDNLQISSNDLYQSPEPLLNITDNLLDKTEHFFEVTLYNSTHIANITCCQLKLAIIILNAKPSGLISGPVHRMITLEWRIELKSFIAPSPRYAISSIDALSGNQTEALPIRAFFPEVTRSFRCRNRAAGMSRTRGQHAVSVLTFFFLFF